DAELTALINFTGLKLGVNEIKISDFNTAAKGKKVTVAEIIDEEKFEYAYSKVNGVDKPVKGKAVLFNKVYETAYEVSLSAAADTRHIVEFGNRVKPDKYKLTLEKHVNGTPFGEWAWKVVIEDETLTFDELYEILASVSFLVYEADEEGNYDETAVPVSTGVLAEEGLIEFLPFELKPGWYVIVEVLEGKAAEIFDVVDPLLIEVGENGNLINISDFDYKAFYTVVNGYGGGYTLGYQGLNNTGDIFYIGVKNAETGIEYPSICANACSTNFAGEGGVGCSGYLVSIEDMPNDVPREDFLKAYNYMYEKYGDLNDIRPVVQIITWALLGAIDVGSEAFDNINWAAVEAGTAAIKGVPDAEDMVYDVFDNYKDFQISNGEIADVIFLVCDKHDEDHDFVKCQPQLVPVYGKLVFNNKTKEDEGFPECPVSFNKVILGGMYNNVAPSLGGYVFYFDLYKLDQGIWHMVNDVDAPFVTDVEGSVITPDLELGSYKFVERPHGVWSIEQQYANGIFFEIRQSVENPRVAEVVWVGGTDANGNKTVVNTPILGPGNGSVTATNDSKNPLIVPNSNHFNYAKLDRADLEKGVVLDMVVGNGNRLVGNALVKLVDGKIVITFNGTGGSFGAIAFNQLPNPGNGNIHSMNEFSHNSQAVITCPPGNTIYLYIHSNSIRFYREILAW
ncbi:MAG: hypothetical protein FWE49_04395, partial [Synergistaceae bacterium]|nr:hypothetical protein [Synergistaceae bacterium]